MFVLVSHVAVLVEEQCKPAFIVLSVRAVRECVCAFVHVLLSL